MHADIKAHLLPISIETNTTLDLHTKTKPETEQTQSRQMIMMKMNECKNGLEQEKEDFTYLLVFS
jgi:hypothetical protein